MQVIKVIHTHSHMEQHWVNVAFAILGIAGMLLRPRISSDRVQIRIQFKAGLMCGCAACFIGYFFDKASLMQVFALGPNLDLLSYASMTLSYGLILRGLIGTVFFNLNKKNGPGV